MIHPFRPLLQGRLEDFELPRHLLLKAYHLRVCLQGLGMDFRKAVSDGDLNTKLGTAPYFS
jgi:hypothetical protein